MTKSGLGLSRSSQGSPLISEYDGNSSGGNSGIVAIDEERRSNKSCVDCGSSSLYGSSDEEILP